jgi:hypothetical protein
MDVDADSPLRGRNGSGDREQLEPSSPSVGRSGSFEKLSKGDVGYGGNAFSGGNGGGVLAAGLLARRLRGLDVKRDGEGES